jgi:hypothetical protein
VVGNKSQKSIGLYFSLHLILEIEKRNLGNLEIEKI